MKTLKFKSYLVEPILNKTKTATWRLFDDKNLSEGDKLEFINSDTMEKFAIATITAAAEKPFCELTDEDWAGHEKYNSDNEMYEAFSKFYNKKVDKNTPVKIISFVL